MQYLTFFKGKNKHYLKKDLFKKKQNKIIKSQFQRQSEINKDIVLKVDIEGDEYKVLKEINKNFNKLNLVIIEFRI